MNRICEVLLTITLFAVSLAFSGCATDKTLHKNDVRDISANRLIQEMEGHNFVFDRFQARFNAKIETTDASFSLKGQIRMENDSIIWLSVSLPIGVEIVRALITNDSVFIINRTDKTYIKESIGNFKMIPPQIAEIGFIQSLLVGNDNTLKKYKKHKVEIIDGNYNLLTYNKIENNNLNTTVKTISVNPETFKINKITIFESFEKLRKVEVGYDKFELVDGKMFPMEIELDLDENPKFYINISYSNIYVNGEQDYRFSIPKKFTPAK